MEILKSSCFAAVVLAALIITTPAKAEQAVENKAYFGMSFFAATYSENGFSDLQPRVIDLRFGRMMNDYFGLEGRLGFGVTEDDTNYCTYYYCVDVALKIQNYYGAYARTYLAEPGGFRPYLLLGFARTKLSASSGGYSASDSDGDFSLGLGFDMGSSESGFTLEYISLYDKQGASIDGYTIGFVNRF